MSKQLGRLYREHRRGLYLLALGITRCAEDAEDAIHEAFARLCRGRDIGPGDAAAYVYASVRNAAVDRVRSRRAGSESGLSLAVCLNGIERKAEERERDAAIAAAMDLLPEDLRIVLALRIYGGLNFRQIGEVTGAPLQTVVSRYRSALERLRPQLRSFL